MMDTGEGNSRGDARRRLGRRTKAPEREREEEEEGIAKSNAIRDGTEN